MPSPHPFAAPLKRGPARATALRPLPGLVALCALGAALSSPAQACYTVYDGANQVVYQAMSPPVDMRFQIHEVLPAVYPGGHLVFGNEPDCPLVNTRSAVAPVAFRLADAQPLRARGGAYAPKPDRN